MPDRAARALLRAFDAAGAGRVPLRGYELMLVARELLRERGGSSHDGIPLPPPRLRVLVGGTPSAESFVEAGQRLHAAISAALEEAGAPLSSRSSILDFGCGCGRLTRHLRGLPARIHGTDTNRELVEWCSANLAFGSFSTNARHPPLDFEDATFDLVIAVSVVTHLHTQEQEAWSRELRRVTSPGGVIAVTTHGRSFADGLSPEERRRFDLGDVVVRRPRSSGTNLCAAYHPDGFVHTRLFPPAEVAACVPGGANGQDLHVFRVPA